MREVIVFQDEAAERVVDRVSAFLVERGLVITNRTPLSVSFIGSSAGLADGSTIDSAALPIGRGTPGAGELPPGTGQIAAVPVQLRPEWCRVWVTAHEGGDAAAAAAELVERERERSRRVEAQVRALETDVYDEAAWPAREVQLRAALSGTGAAAADVDSKIAAFKVRWLALGRKATRGGSEEHLSA